WSLSEKHLLECYSRLRPGRLPADRLRADRLRADRLRARSRKDTVCPVAEIPTQSAPPPATTSTARFIVGLPRPGTTWMCRSLNEPSGTVAFGETMFWGKAHIPPGKDGFYSPAGLQRVKQLLLAKPLESSLKIPGPGGMQHITSANVSRLIEEVFAELPARAGPTEVFRAVGERVARAEGKSIWVEKTPHHLLYSGRILRHFPDARFVAMMRDPYSFLLSYKHQRGHENSDASRRRFRRRYHPAGGALVWRNSW